MVGAAKRRRRSSTTAIPATPAAPIACVTSTPGVGEGNAREPTSTSSPVVQVLVQYLGEYLPQKELLSARLVCKAWSRGLPAGRKHVDLVQPRRSAAGTPATVVAAISAIFPGIESLCFTVSERCSTDELRTTVSAFTANPFYLYRLKDLTFNTTSPPGSRSTKWPVGMSFWPIDVSGLQGLQSLTFLGRAPQTELLTQIAATCTGLTALMLGSNPGDPLPTSPEVSSRLVTRAAGLSALAPLTCLRRLALTLESAVSWNGELASRVAGHLAALSNLTELRLGGAQIPPPAVRIMLRGLRHLTHISLSFGSAAARLYDRKDQPLWQPLRAVDLHLRNRDLEADLPLLCLGLGGSLRALHLRFCAVTPYALTALSSMTSLRELTVDVWTALRGPAAVTAAAAAAAAAAEAAVAEAAAVAAGGDGEAGGGVVAAAAAAAAAEAARTVAWESVGSALCGLLAGSVGQRVEVLKIDLAGRGKDIYGSMNRLAAAWGRGSLRVLHLVNADSYRLSTSGCLRQLAGLEGLRELKLGVQGAPCRDGSCLRAAWLPPCLTSLELVGLYLPCGEQERVCTQVWDRHTGPRAARLAEDRSHETAAVLQSHLLLSGMDMEGQECEGGEPGAAEGEEAGPSRSQPATRRPHPGGQQGRGARGGQRGGVGGRRAVTTTAQGREEAAALGPGDQVACSSAIQAAAPGGVGEGGGDASGSGGNGAHGRSCPGEAGAGRWPTGHARLRQLQRLSLTACRFGCCGHLEAALGPQALPSLRHLELVEVVGLREGHLEALGALKGLTNLAVCTMADPEISSSSVGIVSALTNLRRLRWHAGDAMDTLPHPALLAPLRQLACLDMSPGQWTRMARWHVLPALSETLPVCELAVS